MTSAACQYSPLVSFFPAITPLCESLASQLACAASLCGCMPTLLVCGCFTH